MSTALVTGATGLLGSHIVDRLLQDGWSVRALARNPDAVRGAFPDGVELRQGDVLDEHSFVAAAQGADVIFHAAANIIVRGGWEAYRVTNIEGTRHAILAAARAGARLLHVSSVAVYGASTRYEAAKRGGRTDETTPLRPLPDRAYYARSKRESEDVVRAAHARGEAWTTAIRPCVVYGRRDRQFVPRVGRLLRTGAPIPLLRGGRAIFAIVHAANVADGAVLAATTDAAGGQVYNLTNDFDVSVRRFFELACDGLGSRPLFVPVPLWAAHGGIRAVRAVSRLLTGGRFNLVSRSAVDFLTEDNPFSSERAKSELGWTPAVHPETGIPEAFRWWLDSTTKKGAT